MSKNHGRTPKTGKHEIDLSGQTKVVRVCKMAQFHLMTNTNQSAGRIAGLHSSISASCRFTRQSIHCINRAGLRVRTIKKEALYQ